MRSLAALRELLLERLVDGWIEHHREDKTREQAWAELWSGPELVGSAEGKLELCHALFSIEELEASEQVDNASPSAPTYGYQFPAHELSLVWSRFAELNQFDAPPIKLLAYIVAVWSLMKLSTVSDDGKIFEDLPQHAKAIIPRMNEVLNWMASETLCPSTIAEVVEYQKATTYIEPTASGGSMPTAKAKRAKRPRYSASVAN